MGQARNIPAEDMDASRRHLLSENIRRGRVLTILVILFEACLIVVNIGSSELNDSVQYYANLSIYIVMLIANLAFYYFLRRAGMAHALPGRRVIQQERLITAYVTLMMCSGSAISLMDQRLYGNLIAFMVNMIICSVTYCLSTRSMLIPYLSSTAILAGLLPFFQSFGEELVGHYLNLVMFIAASWAASRIMYRQHVVDYQNLLQVQKINGQLEQEIERNNRMNLQLADANRQLSKLSLLDELTGLPNRRSFRNFIDRMFDLQEIPRTHLSVLMIDLDYFKEYNDSQGHAKGDEALTAVASQIESAVQHTTDTAARWGGEEFVYAAFGMGMPEIRAVAETIRSRVASLEIPHGHRETQDFVTVSIGSGTVTAKDKSDVARCIELADRAMYQAKAEGRNRIVLFEDGNI